MERDGLSLPDHFGEPAVEYRAVREAAGIVDLTFRGLLQITGGERLRWLNGQITQDVKGLRPGEGKPAAVLTVKGHILADLTVSGDEADVWIDLPRSRVGVVQASFNQHIIADDVQIEDRSDRFARLLLVGPRAGAVVTALVGVAVDAMAPWHHVRAMLAGEPIRIVANRWLRVPGLDLVVPVESAGRAWDALLQAGRTHGVRPVGLAALEVLRVEAAWPWFGVDFDESHLLMEALTADHVSFTKGCYIGQEIVTRVEHQGRLNKRLAGLRVRADRVPPRGASILSEGRSVGSITSAVQSPALGCPIALGYIRREHWDPGTILSIATPDGPLEAEIVPLPFIPCSPVVPSGEQHE